MSSPLERSPNRIRNSKSNTCLNFFGTSTNEDSNNRSEIWNKLEVGYKRSKKLDNFHDKGLVKGLTEFNNESIADYRQLCGYLCGLKEGDMEINMM